MILVKVDCVLKIPNRLTLITSHASQPQMDGRPQQKTNPAASLEAPVSSRVLGLPPLFKFYLTIFYFIFFICFLLFVPYKSFVYIL